MKHSHITLRAAELAARPGGVDAAELAADVAIESRKAAGRLAALQRSPAFAIYRASKAYGKGVRSRHFTDAKAAAAWGEVTPPPPPKAAHVYNKTLVKKRAIVCSEGPADMSRAVWTVDKLPPPRFAVELPPGYVSALDASECRDWAKVVA